jgi:CPA2 family monovalent cation:H+ antiporter-2
LTVLVVPVVNRQAEAILRFAERIEPRWVTRTLEAYHGWIEQVQSQPTKSIAWRLIRGRLLQTGVEVLFATGVMLFSPQLLDLLRANAATLGLEARTLGWIFWGAIAIIVLVPLVAIWRNLAAIAMIVGESVGSDRRLPAGVVRNALLGVIAVGMGMWVYALVPSDQLGIWGWIVIGAGATIVVAVFSHKLIYWHSEWQSTVRDVLAEDPRVATAAAAAVARGKRLQDLEQWQLHLIDVIVPDHAQCGGQTLAQLAIPAHFGCAVLEVERNGHVITAIRPDLRIYPGDKLLLLGQTEQLQDARAFLLRARAAGDQAEEFRGSVLETFLIPPGPTAGRTLAELKLAQFTGTRIVGIERNGQKIIAPAGDERLEAGDNVLVAGTLSEIGSFRRWLAGGTLPS